jgi:hypothetical protein
VSQSDGFYRFTLQLAPYSTPNSSAAPAWTLGTHTNDERREWLEAILNASRPAEQQVWSNPNRTVPESPLPVRSSVFARSQTTAAERAAGGGGGGGGHHRSQSDLSSPAGRAAALWGGGSAGNLSAGQSEASHGQYVTPQRSGGAVSGADGAGGVLTAFGGGPPGQLASPGGARGGTPPTAARWGLFRVLFGGGEGDGRCGTLGTGCMRGSRAGAARAASTGAPLSKVAAHARAPVSPPCPRSFGGSDVSGDAGWQRPGTAGARFRPQPLGPETQQLDLLVDTLQAAGAPTPRGSGDGGGGAVVAQGGPRAAGALGWQGCLLRAKGRAWLALPTVCSRGGPQGAALPPTSDRRPATRAAPSPPPGANDGAAAALAEHLAESFVRARQYVNKHADRLPDARLKTLQVGSGSQIGAAAGTWAVLLHSCRRAAALG